MNEITNDHWDSAWRYYVDSVQRSVLLLDVLGPMGWTTSQSMKARLTAEFPGQSEGGGNFRNQRN